MTGLTPWRVLAATETIWLIFGLGGRIDHA